MDRKLTQLRRERLLKTIMVVALVVASTLTLVLTGYWSTRSGALLGVAEDKSNILNGGANSSPLTSDAAPESLGLADVKEDVVAAQQIFGDHARAASFWPISDGKRPRFSYVLYATQKEYLCNAVSLFEGKPCTTDADRGSR